MKIGINQALKKGVSLHKSNIRLSEKKFIDLNNFLNAPKQTLK